MISLDSSSKKGKYIVIVPRGSIQPRPEWYFSLTFSENRIKEYLLSTGLP
jgi:hypothetical protein